VGLPSIGGSLRTAAQDHGGEEVDNQGDSFLFAFRRADQAAKAAIAAQRALPAYEWPEACEVRVRNGRRQRRTRAESPADGLPPLDAHESLPG
jgi:class 3 adenylate cyclase